MKKINKIILVCLLLISNAHILKAEDDKVTRIRKEDVEIESDSIILIDMDTMSVLYEKNSNDKIAPASITKMLANLIAINKVDQNKMYKVTGDAIDNVPPNSSRLWLTYDEEVKGIELINSSLIASANDSTHVLAVASSGTQEAFVKEMNNYVQKLGLKNTHFSNPSGLIEDDHYTTASDYAVIASQVFKNELLTDIMGTNYYEMSPTNKQSEKRKFVNGHPLVKHGKDNYEFIVGGKTGWDGKDNFTMVSYASKDDLNLLVVSLGATTRDECSDDHINLFNYGFSNYKKIKINKNDVEPIIKEFYKGNYLETITTFKLENDFNLLVDYDINENAIKTEVELIDEESKDDIKAVLKVSIKGEYVGNLDLVKSLEEFDVSFANTTLLKIYAVLNNISIIVLGLSILLALYKFVYKKYMI